MRQTENPTNRRGPASIWRDLGITRDVVSPCPCLSGVFKIFSYFSCSTLYILLQLQTELSILYTLTACWGFSSPVQNNDPFHLHGTDPAGYLAFLSIIWSLQISRIGFLSVEKLFHYLNPAGLGFRIGRSRWFAPPNLNQWFSFLDML